MSETGYFENRVELFRLQQSKDGKKVFYSFSGIFAKLPEFLSTRPEIRVPKRDILPELSDIGMETDDALSNGIASKRWSGIITLEWQGAELTIQSVMHYLSGSNHPAYIIAAESISAANSLYQEIHRYLIAKRKARKHGTIHTAGHGEILAPEVNWAEVFLPDGMAEDIRNSADSFFAGKEKYTALKLPYKRGFLFSGPPGCGKTMAIKALVHSMNAYCISYGGMRAARADASEFEFTFAEAREMAPSIVILEDLDKIGSRVPLSTILNVMDGLETIKGVLVIATTNEPDKIDPALLLRPSRFDRVWTFPLPDISQRRKFLRSRCPSSIPDKTIDIVAEKSEGFSMAYVQEIIATALTLSSGNNWNISPDMLVHGVGILRKQIREAKRVQPAVSEQRQLGFQKQ